MVLLEHFEAAFHLCIQFGIVLMECIGVAVLLAATFRSLWGCLRREPHVRLLLAQGIAFALEFKLGGEVLRTVIVRQWNELLILGAIILLRGALTFLIHWEIKNEEIRMAETLAAGKAAP